ncbi:MAG TPA: dihydrolipoamide acetyltransferase family protein [Jiangellaceae bacterium]|nr:dihydrolipoamide acetyltransferase family protein [Jiangellaceae bacterium]
MPDVFMPRLSDTMEEGTLAQWLKGVGDSVRKGDILAEIETDKATMDLEAFDEGILEQLLIEEGATVPIGEPIAIIGDGSGTQTAAPTEPDTQETSQASRPSPAAAPSEPGSAADQEPERIRTSPLARRIAGEHGIDLATIEGTGPRGRILRVDVDAAVAAQESSATRAAGVEPSAARAEPAAPSTQRAGTPRTVGAPEQEDEEVRLSAVRRVTAKRLTESAQTPHFYLTSVVDAEQLLALRKDINAQLADTGTRVSVNDLLIRACATCLTQHPHVNASWADDKILRHKRIHVGVAVAVEDGLMVPVIRDTNHKSLSQIATESVELAGRARDGKLTPDEFSGGTFSISNLGMYGIDHFTAVINPPEAGILAVGAATKEPVVRDDEVVSRSMMKLTLSIDHRVLDGATAAAFLRDLKGILEEPLRIVV